MSSFADRAVRIKFEATMASGEAAFELYMQDNPKHVGMSEIDLLTAENQLSNALDIIRKLRANCVATREEMGAAA